MDESELRYFLFDKNLLQICSIKKEKSKGVIIKEFSKKEDKSECAHKNMNKQKDAKIETEYE